MQTPAQNAWTTGLCDCTEEPSGCGFCLYAFFCQPCAYGSNVELMEPVVCCGGDCFGATAAYCGMQFCTGCACILHLMARGYLRNKYGIPGNGFSDFMITWCCTPCALCQEQRELVIRGHIKGGFANGRGQAQQPPKEQQMVAPGYPASVTSSTYPPKQ
ncbi:hypothetical protein Vretimale_13539 [Volvox reticuliferus]|uniref:Uncharacterized protein n=1 Tax=Volvox reticuliferus TaxID=1737510 RepID=A0A8J4GM69_9CHLO|nr:hypothetical protein Vretifemale_367 [Volvox reticuliferus]GIM09730.1 hypothetical protein Vretimale_13539 [Volvox reticuliferus]